MELDQFIDPGEVTGVSLYSTRRQKVRGHNESVGTICLLSLGIDEHLGDEKQEGLPKAQLFSVSKLSWLVLSESFVIT